MTAQVVTVLTDPVDVVEVRDGTGELITVLESSADVITVYDDGELITITEPMADVIGIVTPDLVGPPGPPGESGPQGELGPAGPEGPVGPFAPTFRQEFADASIEWVIQHDLGVYPAVDIYDHTGHRIGGDVVLPDRNTVVVHFDIPMSGVAIIKA